MTTSHDERPHDRLTGSGTTVRSHRATSREALGEITLRDKNEFTPDRPVDGGQRATTTDEVTDEVGDPDVWHTCSSLRAVEQRGGAPSGVATSGKAAAAPPNEDDEEEEEEGDDWLRGTAEGATTALSTSARKAGDRCCFYTPACLPACLPARPAGDAALAVGSSQRW